LAERHIHSIRISANKSETSDVADQRHAVLIGRTRATSPAPMEGKTMRNVRFSWFGLLILTFIDPAFAQTPVGPDVLTSAPALTKAPSAQSLEDWRAIMTTVPSQSKGCFAASYPSTQWHEVPCGVAPHRRY
jgi:hypothetical protein